MPIYYVIVRQHDNPQMFSIWELIQVIETTLDQIHDLYAKHVGPLLEDGRNYQAFIFYREPENPFRDFGQDRNFEKQYPL